MSYGDFSRQEFLDWAKARVFAYQGIEGMLDVLASFLEEHPEARDCERIDIGLRLIAADKISTEEEMQIFIKGLARGALMQDQ